MKRNPGQVELTNQYCLSLCIAVPLPLHPARSPLRTWSARTARWLLTRCAQRSYALVGATQAASRIGRWCDGRAATNRHCGLPVRARSIIDIAKVSQYTHHSYFFYERKVNVSRQHFWSNRLYYPLNIDIIGILYYHLSSVTISWWCDAGKSLTSGTKYVPQEDVCWFSSLEVKGQDTSLSLCVQYRSCCEPH